jgi:hypothetical protein
MSQVVEEVKLKEMFKIGQLFPNEFKIKKTISVARDDYSNVYSSLDKDGNNLINGILVPPETNIVSVILDQVFFDQTEHKVVMDDTVEIEIDSTIAHCGRDSHKKWRVNDMQCLQKSIESKHNPANPCTFTHDGSNEENCIIQKTGRDSGVIKIKGKEIPFKAKTLFVSNGKIFLDGEYLDIGQSANPFTLIHDNNS